MASEMAKWNAYFERMKRMGKVYDCYDNALKEFNYLSRQMTEDFCFPIGIVAKKEGGKDHFKIVDQEEKGWDVLICNAMFVFGNQPCVVKMVDSKDDDNA